MRKKRDLFKKIIIKNKNQKGHIIYLHNIESNGVLALKQVFDKKKKIVSFILKLKNI